MVWGLGGCCLYREQMFPWAHPHPSSIPSSSFGGSLQEMTLCLPPDSLLIWVQVDEVRPGLCHFARKMPLSAGAMGQVETGQEELNQESLGCQLKGMLETSCFYKVRKWRGGSWEKTGTRGFMLLVPLLVWFFVFLFSRDAWLQCPGQSPLTEQMVRVYLDRLVTFL